MSPARNRIADGNIMVQCGMIWGIIINSRFRKLVCFLNKPEHNNIIYSLTTLTQRDQKTVMNLGHFTNYAALHFLEDPNIN